MPADVGVVVLFDCETGQITLVYRSRKRCSKRWIVSGRVHRVDYLIAHASRFTFPINNPYLTHFVPT